MAGTSPAMTPEKWFNMTGTRSRKHRSGFFDLRQGVAALFMRSKVRSARKRLVVTNERTMLPSIHKLRFSSG
jgi:hypothetical protein